METIIETSIWVDFFRPKTPAVIRQQIHPWLQRRDLALCEPIVCELFRTASLAQRTLMKLHLDTIPVLATPRNLWSDATRLGQTCEDSGVRAGVLDLLIATICLHHGADLITFDKQFALMARAIKLRATVLPRAT